MMRLVALLDVLGFAAMCLAVAWGLLLVALEALDTSPGRHAAFDAKRAVRRGSRAPKHAAGNPVTS